MSRPTIAIATITSEEADQLVELRTSIRRVHKSAPPTSPARLASQELSSKLRQLHRRGVPLYALAEVVGLSHQAVRVRVRNAPESENGFHAPDAERVTEPPEDCVLVTDAGVHRRLHIYDDPRESMTPLLAMVPEVPVLKTRQQIVPWLESAAAPSSSGSPTASPLRVPPAVYVPRSVVNTVLTPLTEEDGETDGAHPD